MSVPVRVRFAPSPTGPLHIGGVRTALYNYLFAKKHHGKFILRIEDTDQTRFVKGAEEYIIESLEWCGLEFDEGVHAGGLFGPYRQSERKAIYLPYAEQLLKGGFAYYAFDKPEELDNLRQKHGPATFQYDASTRSGMKNSLTLSAEEVQERIGRGDPYVIRMKIPANEHVRLVDLIRGEVFMDTNTLDDKVLFKSDGMPTYHLANVVDDHLMEISHVIRGEEWLPSAPLHVLLYRFLGWESQMPEFAHLPLLLKPDGNGKLSKRDGDRLGFPVFPLQWTDPKSGECYMGYREAGFLPEALLNFLALLGWNPGSEQEMFSLTELSEVFSLDRVNKSGAKFDYEKGKWFNQQYVKDKEDDYLAALLNKEVLSRKLSYDDKFILNVCHLVKERIVLLTDLWEASSPFFIDPPAYDADIIAKKFKAETNSILDQLTDYFESLDFSDPILLEEKFRDFLQKKDLSLGAVMFPLRYVITGKTGGPGMFDILSLIGKPATLRRMKNFLNLAR